MMGELDYKTLLHRVSMIERYFLDTEYDEKARRVVELFEQERHVEAEHLARELPSPIDLLGTLLEKLKEKSVYKTLKKISDNTVDSCETSMKGLFSLGTHICIEMEQGHPEYRMILEDVYNRIGAMLFRELVTGG